MGKSTSISHGLTAAKKIPEKAVFCVDNVDPAYGVDDVRAFVRNMSINVISCFITKPRRRRDEADPIVDRKAFRLCIADADRDRLLDASRWPESVTISEWYRIPPSDDRRQQAGAGARSDTAPAATAAARASDEVTAVKTPASVSTPAIQGPSNPTASSVNSVTDEDMDQNNDDTTVLYHDDAPQSTG